jgi:hypothetical protein
MIMHGVMILALVLVICCVLWRWGALIFTLYALWHFCAGEWTSAALALIYAAFITFVRGLASWMHWVASGRDEWRRSRVTR